jgi:hypothetical protein
MKGILVATAILGPCSAMSSLGTPAGSYDLKAIYTLSKSIADDEAVFDNNKPAGHNPCDGPEGDDCSSDDECSGTELCMMPDGTYPGSDDTGVCASKYAIAEAAEQCRKRWESTDDEVHPHFGVEYVIAMILKSSGTNIAAVSDGAAASARAVGQLSLALEAYLFSRSIDLAELKLTMVAESGESPTARARIYGPFGVLLGEKELSVGTSTDALEWDEIEASRSYLQICKDFGIGIEVELCTRLRGEFGITTYIASEHGGSLAWDAQANIFIGTEVSVGAVAGVLLAHLAEVELSGGVSILDLTIRESGAIDGQECHHEARLGVAGLGGYLHIFVKVLRKVYMDEFLYYFGDIGDDSYDPYTAPLLWSTDNCFEDDSK